MKKISSTSTLHDDTPCGLFYSTSAINSNLASISSSFPRAASHTIAMKANPIRAVLEIARDAGFGIEVASDVELQAAKILNFPRGRIVYDSPAKTLTSIRSALECGAAINADSLEEIDRISDAREEVGLRGEGGADGGIIGVRVNPQIGGGGIWETSTVEKTSKLVYMHRSPL